MCTPRIHEYMKTIRIKTNSRLARQIWCWTTVLFSFFFCFFFFRLARKWYVSKQTVVWHVRSGADAPRVTRASTFKHATTPCGLFEYTCTWMWFTCTKKQSFGAWDVVLPCVPLEYTCKQQWVHVHTNSRLARRTWCCHVYLSNTHVKKYECIHPRME